jgi:NADPH-dependent 2,4-dienoyl-CoA reductase/sulfur reductase-like enzyme
MHKDKEKLVIIGGVAAGMSAASQAKRRRSDLEVTVFEKGSFVSYGSCGLPYFIAGLVETPEALLHVTLEEFRSKRGIDVRTCHEVLEIDTEKKQVKVLDRNSAKEFMFPYTMLVYAAGARASMPQIPGIDLPNVFTLRNLEHGIRLKQALSSGKVKKALIMGGGYIGLEMAEAFRANGLVVTMVEMMPRIMSSMDQEITRDIEKELAEKGIILYKEAKVRSLDCGGKGDGITASTNLGDIQADLVLVSAGITPESGLAGRAGIRIGYGNAVAVNDRMETNIPDIYACGDCAETYHRMLRRNVYIPLGTTANKQGRVAGNNVAGGNIAFQGATGTSVFKVFDLEIGKTGLSTFEAQNQGYQFITSRVTQNSRSSYYPGSSPISILLIAEKGSGRILGAQMAGKEGVSKRIDVITAALYKDFTVAELAELDLSYAPPFAPVWDPVLVAANMALKKV